MAIVGVLPRFEIMGADALLFHRQEGGPIYLEELENQGAWQIPKGTAIQGLIGPHSVRAYLRNIRIAEKEIRFVENTYNTAYKGPSDPSRWITEDSSNDVAPYSSTTSLSDTTRQITNRFLISRTKFLRTQVNVGNAMPLSDLLEVLAAQFGMQRGIAESALLSLMNSVLGIKAYDAWPVIRAWVEAGILDCLIDLHWRSRFYFPRTPQALLFRTDNYYELILSGLLPPFLAGRFRTVGGLRGIEIVDRSAVSEFVPSIPVCRSASIAALYELSREIGVSQPRWLRVDPKKFAQSIRSIIRTCPSEPKNLERRVPAFESASFCKLGISTKGSPP